MAPQPPPSHPGHLQTQRPSEPRTSPESLLGLGGTERGTMPRVPQAYTRPGQELCPFQLPSSLAVPQLLICNPNELLTVPICSSLACWGKGARGGDFEKGEAERTVGSRCSGRGCWASMASMGAPYPAARDFLSATPLEAPLPRVRGFLSEEVATTTCPARTPRPKS